jgi:hypothetical protein
MLLRMKLLPGVDNLRNYSEEIIKALEELLLSGGSALPDPKRKGFYDLENDERTFFIQISSITGRVALLATWLRPRHAVAIAVCTRASVRCTA